ncbi:MAG: vanadium-dependent haloperoxidase [Acidobacteria bacterium]|nr:vanadium-dependent haloperoxidase [Acidobacteriota bacterium]
MPLIGSGTPVAAQEIETQAEIVTSGVAAKRAKKAFQLRVQTADMERVIPDPGHPDNGDEARYANKIGNFSKCLKHNPMTGEVEPAAYQAYVAALQSGKSADFDALVTQGYFGCPEQGRRRRLVNPQSGLAFDLEGADSHNLTMRPAPAFASAEEAGEMVELYWMALLRDVNFLDYDSNPLAQEAADDISKMSDFRGPKVGGRVTPQTLFRDSYPGCTTGPYISQFLLQPAGFGAQEVDQRVRSHVPNTDFVTTFPEWLDVQNGFQPTQVITSGDSFFCRNGRDLGFYVHIDVLFQAYFVAFLVLANGGYPLDAGNPYGVTLDPGSGKPLPVGLSGSLSQTGFGTFGGPGIATLVTEPSTRALKAQWFQKWFVHRRLRPEEFGGRVEVQRLNRATYPFHADLTRSTVLDAVFSKYGSHLLPLVFPEGSPNHTSYGSGHATVAGACVTMLKAMFDESAIIRNPVVPSADGKSLVPYSGPALTVGGELNKIVSNVSQGRNIAGVHWRTDATEANKLGEDVAISIMRDLKSCYNETFNGFSLTKFDGTTITI